MDEMTCERDGVCSVCGERPCAALREENARLRQRIEELEERLRVEDKVNRQFGPELLEADKELLEADKRADAAETKLAKMIETVEGMRNTYDSMAELDLIDEILTAAMRL